MSGACPTRRSAQDRCTIALIPGLTTDAFYITMRKGAEMAAKAVGCELLFQGAPEFNPTLQVPVLQAVIARKPDAILIAPTDKQQLIAPLQQAVDAGIPVITVDTFIDDGKYQNGTAPATSRCPTSPPTTCWAASSPAWRWPSRSASKGKVYVSNVKPGISTTDQREEGFKAAMQNFPNITVLDTQFNDNDANKAASQVQAVFARNGDLAGVFGANLFSALGAADGVKALGKSGEIRVVAFDAPTRIVDDLKSGLIDLAVAQHPAEIGYYGVMTAYAVINGQSVPPQIGTGATIMTKDNIDDPERDEVRLQRLIGAALGRPAHSPRRWSGATPPWRSSPSPGRGCSCCCSWSSSRPGRGWPTASRSCSTATTCRASPSRRRCRCSSASARPSSSSPAASTSRSASSWASPRWSWRGPCRR